MINQLYSSIYLGDSSVQRIYQGDDLIYVGERPDILLEYIDNGSVRTQPLVYFDTGVVPTIATKTEIKFSVHTNVVNTVLFGTSDSNVSAASRYYYALYAGLDNITPTVISNKMFIQGITIGPEEGAPAVDVPHTSVVWGTMRDATSISGINMICDSSIYTKSGVMSSITTTNSIYLLARNVDDTADRYCQASTRVYYMKIWQSNNLIRFYIPVLHYINGQYTPCFYDKVNDSYIYNLGTDTPTYKIQGDYVLDWLGSMPETSIPDSSAFYLRYDTGVVASNKLQVDTRGRLVWGREQYLYGSSTSNQTTPSWQSFGFATSGGSTDADKMRFRVDCGASSTSNYRVWISDSSVMTTVNRISHYFDENRAFVYLNDTLYNTPSPVPDTFSTVTIHLLARHGDNSVTQISKGARIYFINFTTSNIPDKTIVPVLHNSKPEFLDLNSGNYIYNLGTATPYYQFK